MQRTGLDHNVVQPRPNWTYLYTTLMAVKADVPHGTLAVAYLQGRRQREYSDPRPTGPRYGSLAWSPPQVDGGPGEMKLVVRGPTVRASSGCSAYHHRPTDARTRPRMRKEEQGRVNFGSGRGTKTGLRSTLGSTTTFLSVQEWYTYRGWPGKKGNLGLSQNPLIWMT